MDVVESRGPSPLSTSASVTLLPLGPDLPPGEDLASVLEEAAGTQVRRLGGLGSFAAISLRGSGYRHVEVFLDGLPLNPDGGATVDLSEFPPSAFERVEIYRGNAPLHFGTAAMGGVVNLITPEENIPYTLNISGGSFGTRRVVGLIGPSWGGLDTLFTVDQLQSKGDWLYFDDAGTEFNQEDDQFRLREHNALSRNHLMGRLRFGPPMARISLLDSLSQSDQELPGGISDTVEQASFSSARNLLALQLDAHAGLFRFCPDLWWSWRQEELDDRAGEIGVGAQWTRDQLQSLGGQFSAFYLPAPWILPQLSVRLRQDRYAPYDQLANAADGVRVRGAGAVAAGADLNFFEDHLRISPVLQGEFLDNHLLGDVPFAKTPTAPEGQALNLAFSPRLGVLYRPWDVVSLKGNIGHYLRPPDLTELFGDRGSVVGNSDLLPETGFAWDLGLSGGLQGQRGHASLDLAWAENWSQDLIVYVQNSQLTQRAENVGQAWVRSVEMALVVGTPWLENRSSLTLMQSRNLVATPVYANNTLPGLPPYALSEQLSLNIQKTFSIAYNFSLTGPNYLDTANLFASAPRPLHGLSVSVSPRPELPTLQLEVLNLLNRLTMQVPLDPLDPSSDPISKPLTDFSGYPLPGRSFFISLSWTASPTENNL